MPWLKTLVDVLYFSLNGRRLCVSTCFQPIGTFRKFLGEKTGSSTLPAGRETESLESQSVGQKLFGLSDGRFLLGRQSCTRRCSAEPVPQHPAPCFHSSNPRAVLGRAGAGPALGPSSAAGPPTSRLRASWGSHMKAVGDRQSANLANENR